MVNFNIFLTGLAQSHYDMLLENPIKKVERKKREESGENDLNGKINGNTFKESDDYEVRV